MQRNLFYTAVGNLAAKRAGFDGKYPVIIVNRKENIVDPQEFAVWSILCWRIYDPEELFMLYADIAPCLPPAKRRNHVKIKEIAKKQA